VSPIALTDRQMHEVQQAALMVPYELRGLYLQQVADRLRAELEIGDGIVHKISYQVAREIS
jgi:hypothetical protein